MSDAWASAEIPYLDPKADADVFERRDPPAHAAIGIVVGAEGEVLLHLRDDDPSIAHPGCWALLGGLCDPGESPRAAVVRELHEEARLPVAHAVPFRRLVDHEGSGHRLTSFVVPTRVSIDQLECREGQELQFCGKEALFDLRLVPFARRLLTEFFAVTLGLPILTGAPSEE